MLQCLNEVMRFFAIVGILCSQVIGINSKTSILWKLNRSSGQIDGFNEDTNQHVSAVVMENFHRASQWCVSVCSFDFTIFFLWEVRSSQLTLLNNRCNVTPFDCCCCYF